MTDFLDLVRRLRPDIDPDVAFLAQERAALMSSLSSAKPTAPHDAPAVPPVVPYLIYDDVAAALDWLPRAFGLRERPDMRIAAPDGSVEHAELDVHGGLVILGPPSVHGASPRTGVSSMVNVQVDDVDLHYQRARAAGAVIVIPLADQPWGQRRYQAQDPEGHQWHFAENLRDPQRLANAHQ